MKLSSIAFVTAPSTSPTVKLSLNDDPSTISGFDPGNPSFDSEPYSVGGIDGYRNVSFTIQLVGSYADVASQMSAISKQLLASRNWLMVKWAPANAPMFLRTYRTGQDAVEWEDSGAGVWRLPVKLTCDPFISGVPVTIGPVKITNDPSVSLTNLSPPVLNAPSTATTGGTLAAATYYYVLTALTSAGETTISNRVSKVTTGATSTVTNTWTAVTGATGYKLYRATVSGSELLLATLNTVTTYVDTGSVTPAGAFPTTNTTAGNPCFYKLPAVDGDAPSPVKVTIVPSSAWDEYDTFMSLAALDKSQAPTVPYVWQTNGFTAGTDTAHDASEAGYSGTNRSTISFLTDATLVTRLSGAAPSSVIPGTYKVFCRMVRSGSTTATWSARFGQAYNVSEYRWGDLVTMSREASPAVGHATWMDLGEFTFPVGATGLTVDDAASGYAPTIALQVQGVAADVVEVDAFVLVPMDTAITEEVRSLLTQFLGYGIGATRHGVWDGTKTPMDFRALDSGTTLAALRPPRVNGQALRVSPDATNIFHLLQQTRLGDPASLTLNNPDTIANSASVTFTYSPLYLHARPDVG